MTPKEFIGYIGTSRPRVPGEWAATADGTRYLVVRQSIDVGRRRCQYDTPIDIRTGTRSPDKWVELDDC